MNYKQRNETLKLEQRNLLYDLSKAGTNYLVQALVGTKEELSFCFDLWEEQSRRIPGIKQDEHALLLNYIM